MRWHCAGFSPLSHQRVTETDQAQNPLQPHATSAYPHTSTAGRPPLQSEFYITRAGSTPSMMSAGRCVSLAWCCSRDRHSRCCNLAIAETNYPDTRYSFLGCMICPRYKVCALTRTYFTPIPCFTFFLCVDAVTKKNVRIVDPAAKHEGTFFIRSGKPYFARVLLEND